MSKIFRAKEAG